MVDRIKTKTELIRELAVLRQRLAILEAAQAHGQQAEQILRASEQRFRTVADFTHDWEYWIGPDRTYLYVSPSCQRITGYPAEEFLQDPTLLARLVHPDDRALIEKHLQVEFDSHEALSLDFRLVTRQGEERWLGHICQPVFDENGQWLGRRASNRDITRRKHIESELLKFSRAMAQIADLVMITDPEGHLEYVNPAFEALTGYSKQEVVGRKPNFLKSGHHPPQFYARLWETIRLGQVYRGVFVNKKRNGELYYEEKIISPVKDEQGQITHFVSTGRDVTALRQAEESLRESERELTRFTTQLQTAAEISTQLTAILNIEQLLYNVVTLLQQRFNLYHVHVYLLNEAGDDLAMRVGSGEIGRLLRQRGHHIPLNQEQSLVAWAARQRELVAVNNVKLEPAFLANPLLPETRSEVALPLVASGRLVGVLDIQDSRPARFTQSDLDVFSTLAGQIAVALENAHLFEQQRRVERELRETRDQLEAILQGIADGIMVIDTAGQLRYVNEAAVRATGYPSIQAMLGVAPADIQRKFEIMSENGQPFPLAKLPHRLALEGVQSPVEILRACNRETGQEQWSVVKARPIFDEQGRVKFAVTITHDITDRKQTEEALRRYATRLQTLHNIDRDILAASLPETIAQVALDYIRQMLPCSRVSVVEFDFDQRTAKILAGHTNGETKIPPEVALSPQAFNVEQLKQGRLHIVPDLALLTPLSPLQKAWRDEGIKTYVNVPLIVQGELIGSLNIGANYPNAFSADHLEIAEEVAISMAIAIQHARLYEQAQEDAETKARLLHEVNHRVKNNLAAIVGLLYIEQNHLKNQPTCQAIIGDLIDRIESLATVHRLLSESHWSPLPLRDIAEQIIHSVLQTLPSGRRIVPDIFSARAITVTPKQANSLAMIINELATNTVKHAVPQQPVVTIQVNISQEDETVVLEYRDNGPGFPEAIAATKRGNIGMYLIENIVHNDLHGSVSFENEHGAVVTIRFKAGD
jgi:PAS domain S-box-containing protein